MKKRTVLIFMLAWLGVQLSAQKYFVSFTDKNNNSFSISNPGEFLSERAIERRQKFNIDITEQDLPVTQSYLDSLLNMGVKIYLSSKWLNGAIIETSNAELIDTITRVSFIQASKLIWKPSELPASQKYNPVFSQIPHALKSSSEYGQAWQQTATVNGQHLHENNYQGENILIAVIDNGFHQVNTLPSFEHLWNNGQIISTFNFVEPGASIFENIGNHGMSVLSIMGGYIPGEIKGSAPKASYTLLRTEDNSSEYPIEEYNWVCAAEYADSIGADIINSSVGYYFFEDGSMSYSYEDMDGQTSISVQGAETAFAKGMVVVCSAGNEGAMSWKYIITPSDGENVLAIAAMQSDSTRAGFSSYGPSFDGRIKPDMTAIGYQTALQNPDGSISQSSGTSFSAPVITGLISCLWQAKPELSNAQILNLVKQSCHNYDNPDYSFGYGIPDFKSALDINSGIVDQSLKAPYLVKPNPFINHITISSTSGNIINATVKLYNINGKCLLVNKCIAEQSIQIKDLQYLAPGIYILHIQDQSEHFTFKLLKK
ncbi:T9SS type A sorting domain-containing protein [Labilibacter sediminis]|nr:T9SS type A sorting domain-containing protein [Labilibacter sediminis]